MNKDYSWFRRDEVVRRCVVVNAFFATMTAGFDTVLEATEEGINLEKYAYVKEGIDEFNRRVNMDKVLFVSQVKRSIYGKAGWEIILNDDETPSWLLSLQSDKLKPKVDEDWELTGFRYEGRDNFYEKDEVLYFTNLQLESDRLGLSDIEPIRDVCRARHELLREDFPEIVRTLWAPYTILQADTSGMTDSEEDAFLEELEKAARSGKSIAINKSVDATVVSMKVDIGGLVDILTKLEEAILRQFGTPRFLVGKPIENRATAYAELEAYVQGPIAFIQRYFKREIEAQWYDRWTRYLLEKKGEKIPEGEAPPVAVKHRWRPIRVTDVYEMAKAVAQLYSNGMGAIDQRKVWDMMGWDPAELEKEETGK